MFETVRRIMGCVTKIQSTKGTGFKTPEDAQCIHPCKDKHFKERMLCVSCYKTSSHLQRKFSPTGLDKCHDRRAILALFMLELPKKSKCLTSYILGAAITAMLFLRNASGCCSKF